MTEDEYRGHGIHPFLTRLVETVSQNEARVSAMELSLESVRKQIDYLRWCLDQSDYHLLSNELLESFRGTLSNVESAVGSIASHLTQDESQQQKDYVQQQIASAQSNLVNIFREFGYPRIQQVFKSEAVEAINETQASARTAIDAIQKDATKSNLSIEKRVSGLRKKVDEETERLNALESSATNISDSYKTFQANVTADANQKAAQFDGLITERRNALAAWEKNLLQEGTEYLEKIKEFYRLSGDTTLAGRFFDASREERTAYGWLTALSLVFFAGAVWALLYGTPVVERFLNVALNGALAAWLARVSLALVFLIPAGVFSQQAAKHRRASVWYRTLGVRVATLKPYLDEFGDDNVDYSAELKEILKSFFISELKVDADRKDAALQIGALENTLARIRSMIK